MKTAKLLACCILTAVAILSCKKEQPVNNQLNAADNDFIVLASASNAAETETAKVAVAKTADTVILSFAQQMILDHSKAQDDLKIMGGLVGFSVKDTIDAAHAAIIAQLDSLTGRAFDSTYIHSHLANDQETTQFCTKEINNGQQLNVRAYANILFQTVQMHYQRADSIAAAFH
jgi:putative membrane protein